MDNKSSTASTLGRADGKDCTLRFTLTISTPELEQLLAQITDELNRRAEAKAHWLATPEIKHTHTQELCGEQQSDAKTSKGSEPESGDSPASPNEVAGPRKINAMPSIPWRPGNEGTLSTGAESVDS